MLFGTGEFLYSQGMCRGWNGEILAEIRQPRGSWRALFLGAGDRVRLARPDGAPILTTVLPRETPVRDVPVEDASGTLIGTIRKRGRDFTVENSLSVPIGDIRFDRNTHVMTDLHRHSIALGAQRPDNAWRIDLRPGIPDTDARLFLAFVIVMDETLRRTGNGT
ncbi:hypothetical protein LUW76_19530 [Actinomadura madurae]|uniref:hypothetical protein n=1 Tax=Actinomadura madurae TaxID=1993 RepID=UPI002026AB9F|nr:hypothetical protein [Actinomadura madurae]URM96344.1 hypothetical protein LUW76_19530 [Actinomadura madurae]